MYLHTFRYKESTCHVVTYSSLNVTTSVCALLSTDEQAVFRSTAMVRVNSKKYVSWSLEKELSFGRKEFNLISGLILTKSAHKFVCPSTKPFLNTKYFSNVEKSVKGQNLKDLLFGTTKLDSNAKVKLSLLYVVHRVVLGKTDNNIIEYDHWHLVDNLVDFNSHPWGEITFQLIIVKTNEALVWGLEILPKLVRKFGQKTITRHWSPHIQCVSCKRVIHHAEIIKVLYQNVQVCENITWHRDDVNRLVMFGLSDGPLVDDKKDDEEGQLENQNVFEKEDVLEEFVEE
ncbi:hypothetical protein MKX01_010854 [Papaver californicum]|nr:hypothetical protein MKX01_010854 [Papaver californicum]